MQVGLGVNVGSIDVIMGQGNLQNTGRLLDIGIEGNAFFGVSDGIGTYYTRCGAFQLDANGYIVLPTNGMALQGKMADSMGNFPPGTAIGNIQIPLNQQSPAKATTEVTLGKNLAADGEAKGSVTYTQRLLHAADGERFFGQNGINDNGRGKHATTLSSLYDSNGKPFNMKEGDTVTMSFYTDTTYENKVEVQFFITGDGAQVNRINSLNQLPDTTSGDAKFNTGNMNINSLEDLMRAIEYTLGSYLDNVSPKPAAGTPGATPGSPVYIEPLSVSLSPSGALEIKGVRSDIFGFSIDSSNPNSGKIDDSASVTKVFNFGSYMGPGVLGSQTYTANGYIGPVTIPAASNTNSLDGAFFPANSQFIGFAGGPIPETTISLSIWAPATVNQRASFDIGGTMGTGFAAGATVVNDSGESISVLVPGKITDGSQIAVNGIVNDSSGPVNVLLADLITTRTINKGQTFPIGCTISNGGADVEVLVPGTVQAPGTKLPAHTYASNTWTAGATSDGTEAIPIAGLITGGTFTQTGHDLLNCINNNGKAVNVFIAGEVAPPKGAVPPTTPQTYTYSTIPAGSKNRGGTDAIVRVEKEASTGVLLRPAEQFDYLADILSSNGESMNLIDGAVISFTASVGDERMNSSPLTFKKGSTLLDDLMMQLRNDLKLPYDYMGKDNNRYPSVALKTPSLGEDGIPEGALVFRGLPGEAFSINDLTINARNPGGVAIAPKGFQEAFATTLYKAAENAEVVPATISIFDASGAEHVLRFEFTHTGVNGEWIWKASFSGNEIIQPPGSGSGKITFGRDGTLAAWLYDDGGSALQFDPANGAKAMRVKLNVGGPGNWKGLTSQAGVPSSVQALDQDGYTSGSLTEMSIDEFGLIEGKFSNGINRKIAQIMVVDFANPGGLMDVSDNVYSLSANSGNPIWGKPKTQSSSSLRPGSLEMSNVDLASEFTNMITTQRGYQANSRIITVSDTMLEEAVNLKR